VFVDFFVKDYRWIPSRIEQALPNNAVIGGTDTNRDPIYVGRFPYANDMLPAKIIPAKGNAFAAYDGEEVSKESYEVSIELRHQSPSNPTFSAVQYMY
jgi:hypothetical protein